MESHNKNNEKVDGVLVYRHKKKRTASEATSEACKGRADDHANKPDHDIEENRCDNGGTMIFCKPCSNSYHCHRLSPPPPLKSIPDGDWRCPNCSNNDDLSTPIRNFKTHKKENNSSSSCSLCSKAKKKLKLSENEVVKTKSSKSSSADKPNASAEFDKTEVGSKEGAAVHDQDTCGAIRQHTLNKNKVDKLLMLSKACIESMEKLLNAADKDKATKQQPDRVVTKKDQNKKEKYVQLRARQKEKVALKDKNKEPLSCSRPIKPKPSSDLQMIKYDELVALNALTSWKDTPNPSSHLKNNSASGLTLRPENINTTASRKSSAFRKFEKSKDYWSEVELDALWLAVRRHGEGNWQAILADPFMTHLKNKSPQDLATKWDKETRKIFPSAVPLQASNVFSTPANSSIPHASSGINGYPFTDPTMVHFPAHVFGGSGIQRFPVGEENQSLMRGWNMPSWNSGILGCYNQEPSSIFSHPIQGIASPLLRPSNVNMNPTFTELLLQTHQRANNLNRNMRSMRVQAIQTPAEAVFTTRNSSSTNAEAE